MIENMSIVFLFIGLMFLAVLFYEKNLKSKIFLSLPLGVFLASFFIDEISTTAFEIDILIILGTFGILAYFLKKSKFINVCIFSILLTIIYVFILNLDNLYLTSFDCKPMLLIGLLLNLLFSANIFDTMSNAILSGICMETINFIYYQNFFKFSRVFDFSFLNFIFIYALLSTIMFLGIKFIKKLLKGRKAECCPLKSQF